MSDASPNSVRRSSYAAGFLALFVAGLSGLVLLFWLAGPFAATAAGLIFGASVCLAFLRRIDSPTSRDPSTGLPDRDGALASLATILGRSASGQHEAAVIFLRFDTGHAVLDAEERRQLTLVAAMRMAQRLRKNDQIVHLGDGRLAAILGPSLGLTGKSAEGILGRIAGMFDDPLNIGGRSIEVTASVGACLQHDAPETDARSWLRAAESAAEMAAREGRPRLFPSGATSIDCLFDPTIDIDGFASDAESPGSIEEEARWRQPAMPQDGAKAREARRPRSA